MNWARSVFQFKRYGLPWGLCMPPPGPWGSQCIFVTTLSLMFWPTYQLFSDIYPDQPIKNSNTSSSQSTLACSDHSLFINTNLLPTYYVIYFFCSLFIVYLPSRTETPQRVKSLLIHQKKKKPQVSRTVLSTK